MKIYRRLFSLALFSSLLMLGACSGNNTSEGSNPNNSPTSSSSISSEMSQGMAHGGINKININNAILSELDKIEAKLGIPALSNKIQASRPYGTVEELVGKNVLTQEQFDQIKDLITVEDIVLEGEAKDIDYMTKLGLMKGHLIVAQELLALKKPDQAEPHIGHPVEEIYADVEDQLTERNVSDFKDALISLQDLVRAGAKDQAKVDSQFTTSMQGVDGAIAVLSAQEFDNPHFLLQVINGLLDTANSEYGAAVINGKISAPIEYQDSRGFVLYADQLYQKIAPEIEKTNPTANQSITKSFTELKTVWPSVIPPATPVKTSEQVTALVKGIEQVGNQIEGSNQ